MRRALALAERGRGNTRPNPIVGAVIARDGKVVAEGFHRRAGDVHAEVAALNAAATLDGFIADRAPRRRRAPVWITGQPARAVAHELRASHDAVLVGAGTVAADDPLLTVRLPGTKSARGRVGQPIRVVLDGRLRTSPRAQVLRANGSAGPTIVIGAVGAPAQRVRALEKSGAAVELLPARRGRIALRQL